MRQLKQYRIYHSQSETEADFHLVVNGQLVATYSPYFSRFDYVDIRELHYLIPFMVWISRYSIEHEQGPCKDRIEQELINTGWTHQ